MIVELRTYTIQPGRVREYLEHYETTGVDLHKETLGNLLGVFTPETGELDQLLYLNGYSDLNDRAARRARLYANPEWQHYTSKVRPLITRQESRLLVPASCSPIR